MATVSRPVDLGIMGVKREGLGLGGINLPVELGGSPVAPEAPTEARYAPLRSKHSASYSSPPSLVPFAASLKSSIPAPTPTTARKSSLQNLSGNLISYPIVSRIDLAPTYTPASSAASAQGKGIAIRKEAPESHSSFLTAFKRVGHKARDLDSGAAEDLGPTGKEKLANEKSRTESRSEKSSVSCSSGSSNSRVPLLPFTVPSEDEGDLLKIRLPSSLTSAPSKPVDASPWPRSTLVERGTAPTAHVPVPSFASSLSRPANPPSPAQPRPAHRRSTSEESPRVAQNAFARAADVDLADKARPATVFSATPAVMLSNGRRPSFAPSGRKASLEAEHPVPSLAAARRGSRPRSITSTVGLPKPEDAFFPSSVGVATSSTPLSPASTHRRPSAVPRPVENTTSVGISVREGAGNSVREVGRAAFGDEGLTVSLRSCHRPDEVEVGWMCITGTDEEGRAYTTWEMRLRPRVGAHSNSPPPRKAAPPKATPAVHPSSTGAGSASFHNYRMGGPSVPPLSSTPGHASGLYHPTSPRSAARRTSSNRSEGSSFSSESSTPGPPTPRRGKHSIVSMPTDHLPPFDLDAVLSSQKFASHSSRPLSLTSSSLSLHNDADTLPPRRRKDRASSYASVSDQRRTRQFSIDEEGIMSRSASFSVGPGSIAVPPKSPKHHRFGCYIPPLTTGGVDFAALAKEAKRKSAASEVSFSTEPEVKEAEPPVPSLGQWQRKQSIAAAVPPPPPLPTPPTSSSATRGFLASRGRKQSIAPPSALVIPAKPSSTCERISPSSFQPSPLSQTTIHQDRSSEEIDPSPTAKVAYLVPGSIGRPPLAAPQAAGLPALTAMTPPSPIAPPLIKPSLLFPPGASPVSSDSSFGNAAEPHSPAPSFIANDDADDVFEAKLVVARQAKRLASTWSDTEDGEEDEGEDERVTSWSRVPDAVEIDQCT